MKFVFGEMKGGYVALALLLQSCQSATYPHQRGGGSLWITRNKGVRRSFTIGQGMACWTVRERYIRRSKEEFVYV